MLDIENNRRPDLSDSQLINHCIEKCVSERGGGDIRLAAKRYFIDESLVLRSGIRLIGEGVTTVLAATPALTSPVLVSENHQQLEAADAWFHSEGVPVRFRVSDLMIDGNEGGLGETPLSGTGMYLYGKGFEIVDVQITGMKRHGLISVGSARGGQETWLDEPEALFDLRISRCGGDGFIMRGPHDSIIRQAIIAICKGRGLAVEVGGAYNGACDVEFCHAYATDSYAIDLGAKVKAGFLQGDTGRKAGVRVAGSNKTYIDRIEVFKTRGTAEDFALDILAPYTQIGLARVRADWGASGVRISGRGSQIGLLDIDGMRNTGGPLAGTDNETTGLLLRAPHCRIGSANIRNFANGRGLVVAPKLCGVHVAATTEKCAEHLSVNDQRGSDLQVDMVLADGETYQAEATESDKFFLRPFWS